MEKSDLIKLVYFIACIVIIATISFGFGYFQGICHTERLNESDFNRLNQSINEVREDFYKSKAKEPEVDSVLSGIFKDFPLNTILYNHKIVDIETGKQIWP